MSSNSKVKQFAIQSPGIIRCPVCWNHLSSENLMVSKGDKGVNADDMNRLTESEGNPANLNSAQNALSDFVNSNNTAKNAFDDFVNSDPNDSKSENPPNDPFSLLTERMTGKQTQRLRLPESFAPDGTVKPNSNLYCGNCKQAIPRDYLMRQSFPVSLVGISNAGKTSFLASMTERFTHPEIQERFNLSCDSFRTRVDAKGNGYNTRIIKAHEDFRSGGNRIPIPKQTDDEILVSVGNQKYAKPYIFKAGAAHNNDENSNAEKVFWNLTSHLQSQINEIPDHDINLVFHDILGGYYENLPDDTGNDIMRFLENMAGNNTYLIFYDPTTNRSIIELHNKNLMGTDKDELALLSQKDIQRQSAALSYLRDSYVQNATEIIVLVTKFDIFKRLFIDFIKSYSKSSKSAAVEISPSANPVEDAILFGKLFQYSSSGVDTDILTKNRDFLSRVSNYLKKFLDNENLGDDFFSKIRELERIRGGKEILCLPVSSLGSSVACVENGVAFIRSFRPIWVEVVFCLIWNAIRTKMAK